MLSNISPSLYRHFRSVNITVECYLFDWVRTLFSDLLPLRNVARLWDCIMLEVWSEKRFFFFPFWISKNFKPHLGWNVHLSCCLGSSLDAEERPSLSLPRWMHFFPPRIPRGRWRWVVLDHFQCPNRTQCDGDSAQWRQREKREIEILERVTGVFFKKGKWLEYIFIYGDVIWISFVISFDSTNWLFHVSLKRTEALRKSAILTVNDFIFVVWKLLQTDTFYETEMICLPPSVSSHDCGCCLI